MKTISLCIGVFLLLFLGSGVYKVQAQDLSEFNGHWLNGVFKMQNVWVTDGSGSTTVPEKIKNYTENFYACVRAGAGGATLLLFKKNGTFMPDFTVQINWVAGTNDDFVATLNIGAPHTSNTGFVRVKDGKFQSINGYTVNTTPGELIIYDIIFSGKIIKKVPRYMEAVNCATFSP